MNKNIEKELKILVTKDQFHDLLTFYDASTFILQHNVYFDTESSTLKKLHGAMRIRKKQDRYIFTLKIPSDDSLLEYETDVQDFSIDHFEKDSIKTLLASFDIHGPFQKIADIYTERCMIDLPNAELCFDKNEFGTHKDFEIEYEYKKEHDGISVFNEILKPINVKYESNCDSKIVRALKYQNDIH